LNQQPFVCGKTLTILLFLKWLLETNRAFPLSISKGLRLLFESIWNFGAERFIFYSLAQLS
jgi:hypothetical protein